MLKAEFGNEYRADQLVDLNRYEIVIKLLEDGTNWQPFRAMTLPPIEGSAGRREKLIARSRGRFATPRNTIETKLTAWLNRAD